MENELCRLTGMTFIICLNCYCQFPIICKSFELENSLPKLSMRNTKIMTSKDLKLLQSIFTAASEGIIIVNRKGQILMSNPSAQTLFGYSPEELMKLELEALIPTRFRKNHPKYRHSYFESPKSRGMGQGLDLSALRKDNSEFPVEISLSSFESDGEILTVAFIIDVTLRKTQEKALKESRAKVQEYAEKLEEKVQERTYELEHLNLGLQSQVQERKMAESALLETQKLYNAIAENFPNGIISVLDLDLNYVFVNGAEMASRKWQAEDLIGNPYFDWVGNKKLLLPLIETLRNEGTEFSKQIDFNRDTYQVHGVPLYDEEENLFQVLIVEENITKQKKAEEEIRTSLQKAKELNDLKTRFVSMASHEFRTPLSTILSSISLIGKYPNDARDKREKHITRVKSSITNMTNILNDFLSIGKLEEGKIENSPEKIKLIDLFNHISEEFEGSLKPNQKLFIKGEEIEMYSDPKLIKNIFLNLISNAIKYSNEGSKIEIAAKRQNGQVQIDVTDEGLGIPEDEQKNIFTRFYRAGNATNIQGTGLGLHIVKKYVELMNGQITFRSKLNVGTTFTLKLPHHEKEAARH